MEKEIIKDYVDNNLSSLMIAKKYNIQKYKVLKLLKDNNIHAKLHWQFRQENRGEFL